MGLIIGFCLACIIICIDLIIQAIGVCIEDRKRKKQEVEAQKCREASCYYNEYYQMWIPKEGHENIWFANEGEAQKDQKNEMKNRGYTGK